MLKFWGDGSQEAKALVDSIVVRSTANFNWTFIFILSVVFYVYWSEIHKKNTEAVCAGLALYGVHWLYEIANAVIGHVTGYPLWSVSNASTTYILLVGVCWELSMMFSLAGIISFKMMPQDRSRRYFAKNGRKGISCKLVVALEMALLFALVESFLAGTSNHSFIWVYKWWGVIPVFITTYIPFFLASNYVPDMEPAKRRRFLICEWGLVALLLVILILAGIICFMSSMAISEVTGIGPRERGLGRLNVCCKVQRPVSLKLSSTSIITSSSARVSSRRTDIHSLWFMW